MYRATLILLWTGTIVFGAAATLDVFIDFMKNAQGILIGAFAMMFVSVFLHVGLHHLNETAKVNGQRGKELLKLSETKTAQVRGDVDQLREQVGGLDHKVEEVRDWAEAQVLIEEAAHPPKQAEPEQEPCPIYQLRIRDGRGREAIVGKRTPGEIDAAEVWPLFRDGETGTLPGTSAS